MDMIEEHQKIIDVEKLPPDRKFNEKRKSEPKHPIRRENVFG
jgi:hypothetical protein